MNEGTQAQAADTSTAAPTPAADVSTSQPDLSNLSIEEMDAILYRGETVEVPVAGGEGKTTDQVAPEAEAKVEAEPGDKPVVVEAEAAAEEVVVVETRTPEEILADQHAAVDAVVAAGGDDAAQQAAADAAALPQPAKVEPEPVVVVDDEGMDRARFKDERDQLIVGIYKRAEHAGKPITWAEAEARVDGPKVEEATPAVVVPPVDHAALVGTLETEIAGLEAELDNHEEGLYTKEVRQLEGKIRVKQGELVLAKIQLQDATKAAEGERVQAIATSEANRTASHAKAIAEFPDAGDDNTALGKDIASYVQAIKDPKHPDHDLLYADNSPLIIARNRAAELGIAPVKAKTVSPPVKPPVTAPLRQLVTPAPGNKTAVVPGKPVEDAKSRVAHLQSDKATLAELDAAFGAGDQSTLLAGAVR